MKFKLILTVLFVFIFLNGYSQLRFDGLWKYTFKDNESYSNVNFDDNNWESRDATQLSWKKVDLEGRIVWLRKTMIIPSSLKSELKKSGVLMLSLGVIKEYDKTYFNGELLGAMESGDLKRKYLLTVDKIKWDQENTIAIRMSHWGTPRVEEVPTILAANAEKLFITKPSKETISSKLPVEINKLSTVGLEITNKGKKIEEANLVACFFDMNKAQIGSMQKKLALMPGMNVANFSFKSPSTFLKVTYQLNIKSYNYSGIRNDEFGYLNVNYVSTEPKIPYKVKEIFNAAKQDEQVISGWLGDRLKANKEQRLYKVDETALLEGYINKPGSHPWIGEHVGKFLETACNTYLNTKDQALKIQIDRTAQQLIAAQLEDGYLGTYEPGKEWTSWDVWSHKYNILGLLSYYQLSGYQPALQAAEKMGTLLHKKFGYQTNQLDIIKAGAHVGMAATSVLDPMVDLYRFTGKQEYLDFCYYIIKSYTQANGPNIINALNETGRVDKTANAKAYEMLSNIVGLVKLYRLTADDQFLKPCLLAWNDIVKNRLYITGTTSSFEHFQDDNLLPADKKDNMGEGCVTTTWIQLNGQLANITGEIKYIDELERSVYNHLTGAENPQTGCVSYYTPLMGSKPYGCNITCCLSSVPRGIAMIPSFANGKINGNPSFLFYQAGSYKTSLANNLSVEFLTNSNYLDDGKLEIIVNPEKSSNFQVSFRKPYWAKDFSMKINGENQDIKNGNLISIARTWKKGDQIQINFELPITTLDGGKSYPNYLSFQRGPQILVFDKKLNSHIQGNVNISSSKLEFENSSKLLPEKWIGSQAYSIKAKVDGVDKKLILVPYADASQTGGEVNTWLKSIIGQ